MKIEFNRLDDLNARLTIVIQPSDYAPKLDENIKKYSKKVALKGFRSGKTPKSVLTKMYGKGMLEETITGLLNEKIFGYLEEQGIEIFGSPVLSEDTEPVDFNIKEQVDYAFVYDLGLKPVFSLEYHSETPLEIVVPAVDHSAIDADILHYRRIGGEETPVPDGPIDLHDRITLNLQRLGHEGQVEEVGTETNITLNHIQGEAKEAILPLQPGASLDVDLEKFLGYPRNVIVEKTLQLENDPDPDAALLYRATIQSVHRPQMTELTGEQLERFTGRALQDENEFRQMLVARAMEGIQSQVNDMKKMVVRLTLLESNPFGLPESFLLQWINHQRDKAIEPASREAEELFRNTKWSLILNRIAKEEGLEVTEKDIQHQVTNWVIRNTDYQRTDIRKLMKRLYDNEYFMSSMKENALEQVVFAQILPKYQFVEKEVTDKEFEKAFHDLHHTLFNHEDHDHGDHDHHDEHSHDEHEHSHG